MPEEMGIPSKFGNAADYWKYFDEVAGPRNRRMMDGINQNLDITLVFGGLFAGVIATFFGFILPMLNPDPAAQTNHLLTLLLKNGMGQFNLTDEQLMPPQFTPTPEALRLARLLSVSLTMTLLLSVGAMVGKICMIYYNRGPQGGPSERESRILQKKLAGVYRWGLRLLPELIGPVLFQVALIVFGEGVAGFLTVLDNRIAWINSILAWIAVAIFAGMNAMAIWDPWFPLQTPLSKLIFYIISLRYDVLPSIVLRMVKTAIEGMRTGASNSMSWNWRQPCKTIKQEREILANTVDSSYIRTLSHRFALNPIHNASSKVRRRDEPNEVMDAHFACYLLRKTEQSDVLLSVAQSIPALFDKTAISILLADNMVFKLHQFFRTSIGQAGGDPNAMTQDSDDKSSPIENAVLCGRAIVHLFVALGPHDDWFWDDYETSLDNGWMDSWDVGDEQSAPKTVLEELKHQRLVIQAILSLGPDKESPSMEIESSALPLYIAASTKLLLHRRAYHNLAHSLPKFCRVFNEWTGEDNLERIAFCSTFPRNLPTTIGLVAWALAIIPARRAYEKDHLLKEYGQYWEDMKGLWDAYYSTSNILLNVGSALHAYPLEGKDHSESTTTGVNVQETYVAMLEAAQLYILEDAPKTDVGSHGPNLLDCIGRLNRLMEKNDHVTEEDEAMRGAMQSVMDAVVVRRGKRIQQHKRTMSASAPLERVELEKGWFSGGTPTALEEYDEWIINHRSPSPDPMEEPRTLFMEAWRKQRGEHSVINVGVAEPAALREVRASAAGGSGIVDLAER